MRLSIITINYNNSQGLGKTLESVKNQICSDFEYIVVDGNSNDGSKNIIKKYESCITHWVSEPDTGIYNAMNKGAHMSTGDYMLFLNSGDFLYSESSIKNILEKKFDEDIICCSLYSFNKEKGFFKLPPQFVSLYSFIGGGSMLHPSTLISRKIFDKVGGYIETYKIISDWCFFVDAMIVENCSYKVYEDIVLTSFNCYGISSQIQNKDREHAQMDFLKSRFPRIITDYISLEDEAISNSALYISHCSGLLKLILSLPLKLLNKSMRLRKILNRRTILKDSM